MAKAGGSRGRPRSVATQEKAMKAADMRIAGAKWPAIAEELGYASEAGARQAVRRFYERGAHDVFERMHPILNGRAELLWRQAYQRMMRASTTDEWDRAMRHCTAIVQMQARLNGLGNQNVQVTVGFEQPQQVKDLQSRFQQLTVIEGGLADSAPPALPVVGDDDGEDVDDMERLER